jgi:hypothetical protein
MFKKWQSPKKEIEQGLALIQKALALEPKMPGALTTEKGLRSLQAQLGKGC